MNSPLNIDHQVIAQQIKSKEGMKKLLKLCAACGACSDTCFYYMKTKDPRSTPAYKMLNTLGVIFKKKNRITETDLKKMPDLLWGKCVMCRRCTCPFGIDISAMISFGRFICRNQGISEDFSKGPMGISQGDEKA